MLPEELEVDLVLEEDDEDDVVDDLFVEKLPVLLFVRGVVILAAG
jgi:hypothetical protein